MADKRPTWEEIERDRDEPVKLPLDPETALQGLIAVDPDERRAGGAGATQEPRDDQGGSARRRTN